MFHFKRKWNNNNCLSPHEIFLTFEKFYIYIYIFCLGFDFSMKICRSFRKRFHNNSSKKLLRTEAQTGQSFPALANYFSLHRIFKMRGDLSKMLQLEKAKSSLKIRDQKPPRRVSVWERGAVLPLSSARACFNFLHSANFTQYYISRGCHCVSLGTTTRFSFSISISTLDSFLNCPWDYMVKFATLCQ